MNADARKELFERLLGPHMPRLYRLACRLTHSRIDADELLQASLARVYTRLDELRHAAEPATWLAHVLYSHHADNRLRWSRERAALMPDAAQPGTNLAGDDQHDAVWAERMQLLKQALDVLSEKHRVVVLLHDAEGLSRGEVERITGESAGTIRSRLHIARQQLRELLADDESFA